LQCLEQTMGFNLDDYEPVAARQNRWLENRMGEYLEGKGGYPRTITHMVSEAGADICVIRAELWLGDVCIATGYAEEVRGAGNVNRTSHVENCETSAVGRALANAGMAGSDVSKRPSREEMSKVQNTKPKMRITQSSSAMADANGISIKGNQYGDIPDWLVLEAAQAGVTQVWDNRDKVAGTKRPWFKDVNGDKAFWPPRGTPDPIIGTHEDDLSDPGEEEPF
jgi:hypothetical protein